MEPRRRKGLVAAMVLCLSTTARANGRFPSAQHVVARGDVVALRTTLGVMVNTGGRDAFTWLCEDALFQPVTVPSETDPALAIGADGRVAWGFPGGVHASVDGCSVTRSGALAGAPVVDLATGGDGAMWALTSDFLSPLQVWRRTPTDADFAPVGAPMQGLIGLTLDVAPSDARRLYLSALGRDDGAALVFRSDDGGISWRTVSPVSRTVDSLWVAAVDARLPDRVWIRALARTGASSLWQSDDGGVTARLRVETPDPMLGVAVEGDSVWAGSPRAGLFRGDVMGVEMTARSPLPVYCLGAYAGTLWRCADWPSEGYLLGRSTDGGASFTAALRWSEVRAEACHPRCVSQLASLHAVETTATRDAGTPVDVGGAMDVGTGTPRVESGCAVHARGGRWGLVWLVLVAALRRRRRNGNVAVHSH